MWTFQYLRFPTNIYFQNRDIFLDFCSNVDGEMRHSHIGQTPRPQLCFYEWWKALEGLFPLNSIKPRSLNSLLYLGSTWTRSGSCKGRCGKLRTLWGHFSTTKNTNLLKKSVALYCQEYLNLLQSNYVYINVLHKSYRDKV